MQEIWEELQHLAARETRIAEMFEDDPLRADSFAVEACGMRFDYAKTAMDEAARNALLRLARAMGWRERLSALCEGQPVNETEGRAVMHLALRRFAEGAIEVEGSDVMPEVLATRERLRSFAREVREGGRFDDVVNIGIGGSDLGPAMAVRALAPYHDGPRVHFVSNVDPAHVSDTLRGLDARRTLVIVASKSFTTIETMTNARTARAWMAENGGEPKEQFAAVSTALDRTAAFGVPDERVFGFADWVGGRYSVWGPVGLPLMIAIGPEAFAAFQRGGEEMDIHVAAAQGEENMPLMLALSGIWHRQVCGHPTRAVLPYDQRLARLPAYLQQLEMESNGKSVQMSGEPVPHPTGPVVWGEPGTNGQHAFFQLLHQGTDVVPCEFMVAARGHEPDLRHQHDLLVANCLAQSEALMIGRSLEEAKALLADRFDGPELEKQARHRVFPGNRPSTTLAYPLLDPARLGAIIALYEWRVFIEGVILGINSYDQWGVELGKEMATALGPIVSGDESAEDKDGSTRRLAEFLLDHREGA